MLINPAEVALPVLAFGAVVTFITGALIALRYAIYKIPGRLSGRIDPARDQIVDDLQLRVTELEEVKHRVIELEERLDFAERMLAKRQEGPNLLPAAKPNTLEQRPVTPT